MCGIAGFSGNFSPELLSRMSENISHRGPDGNGEWFSQEDRIGLAHRRLSIIDLSPTGAQPMWNGKNTAVIVFNGEIYNYRELHKLLVNKGYSFRGTSDTEVLITLYDAFGGDMLPMLNGIFAFAIWDTIRKEMFLARDGFGVKPLYYTSTPSGFCFSSEMKSLMKVPDLDTTISYEAIHCYLTYLWCPSPLTPLKNTEKLEPGFALSVKNGHILRKWRYYDIPLQKKKPAGSLRHMIQECGDRLSEAVKRQMVADVEVATFLSGGLDSTSISYFANKHRTSEKLTCFTMRCDTSDITQEGLVDDLPFAERAAKHLGVDLRIVDAKFDLFNELPFMIYHLDEPQADAAPYNVFQICKLARESGIKVLLSGAGGDDLFTGYRRHQALHYRSMLDIVPPALWKLVRSASSSLPDKPHLLRRIKKAVYSAAFTGGELLESYFRWMRSDIQSALYHNDFREAVIKDTPVLSTAKGLPGDTSLLDRMLYLEMKYFLSDHNLNYSDKMSMATGVEVRVPFLDPDLVNFAFSLPDNVKQHGGEGKWILKKAMEPYLPHDNIYRSKTGFGVPLRTIIRSKHDRIMEEYLSKSAVVKRGMFDHEKICSLVNANQTGRIEGAYTIFSLICLETWMRIFIDGKGGKP